MAMCHSCSSLTSVIVHRSPWGAITYAYSDRRASLTDHIGVISRAICVAHRRQKLSPDDPTPLLLALEVGVGEANKNLLNLM